MAVDSATYIADLNVSLPVESDPVAEGNENFQNLKAMLKNQFSGLETGVPVTATAAQINSWEARIAALEEKDAIDQLPVAAYDFNNAWWTQNGSALLGRYWGVQIPASSLSNCPFPWGASGGGATYNLTVIRLINDGVGVALNIVFRHNTADSSSAMYYRQAQSAAGLTSSQWQRATWAEIDTAPAANAGDILYTTVCNEYNNNLNNPGC